MTIWNDNGAYLQLWRSVFERQAPTTLPQVERLVAPGKVGQGTYALAITKELLDVLTEAYREAATGTVTAERLTNETPAPPDRVL